MGTDSGTILGDVFRASEKTSAIIQSITNLGLLGQNEDSQGESLLPDEVDGKTNPSCESNNYYHDFWLIIRQFCTDFLSIRYHNTDFIIFSSKIQSGLDSLQGTSDLRLCFRLHHLG